MTTHYQKIQALGNKMVSNLESMGVSANFNDGGMTLADKILEIQHFDNGLKLYADKNIGQIEDKINLYALVLKDNIAQSGKTILFKGLVNSTGTTKTFNANSINIIGDKYEITSFPNLSIGSKVYLDKDHKIWLVHMAGYGTVLQFLNQTEKDVNGTGTLTKIVVENNTLTYWVNGYGATIDFKNNGYDRDLSVITTENNTLTITDYSVYGVTGNNGIANVTYTCSDVGDKNIQAIYQSSAGNDEYSTSVSGVVTVTVVNSVLYQPALDGTESFTQVSDTTTIANGEMYGGGAFLNNGWDNSSDWKLTFQYKAQYRTGMWIAPLDQNIVDFNGLELKNYNDNEISVFVNGKSNKYSVDANAYPNNTYVPVTIVKNNSTFTIIINNYTYTVTWDNSSYSNLCIGVHSWKEGYSSYVKDIKVVRLSVLYQPALDGTESFTQVSGTTTIAKGEMYGGTAFLNNGWDNSSDWKLTFQYKAQDGTGMWIAPLDQNIVEMMKLKLYNGLQLKNYTTNEISVWVNGKNNKYSVDANAYPNDTYVPVTIVKNSSTFTITINNYTYTVTWDNSSYSNLCIGVHSWGKGYPSYVKDIKVVRL